MYLNNGLSGYGTSDFNKALKGTNIAAIQKGIDVQTAQLAKSKKPKDIERNTAQLQAAQQRMAEVLAMQNKPPTSSAPVPTVTAPPPTTTPPATSNPYPGVPATVPTVAPPSASDSTAVIQSPATTGIPTQNFGPAFGPPTDGQVQFDPSTSAPAAAAPESSNMPIILGALGLGALFLFMRKKKRG